MISFRNNPVLFNMVFSYSQQCSRAVVVLMNVPIVNFSLTSILLVILILLGSRFEENSFNPLIQVSRLVRYGLGCRMLPAISATHQGLMDIEAQKRKCESLPRVHMLSSAACHKSFSVCRNLLRALCTINPYRQIGATPAPIPSPHKNSAAFASFFFFFLSSDVWVQ